MEGEKVRCLLCPNECLLSDGCSGKCRVRQNVGMSLKLINYGEIVCSKIDDIKDRPISCWGKEAKSISLGMAGCNNHCPFCQNYKISQNSIYDNNAIYPESVIEEAIKNNVDFISFTFTEPIVWFEFINDVYNLSKQKGIKICVKTSGYISEKMMPIFLEMIDVINVDIKPMDNNFDSICGIIDREIPLIFISESIKRGIHTEISHIIIEGINDGPDSMSVLYSKLKDYNIQNVPVNFIKHYPSWKSEFGVTSEETLRECKKRFKEEVDKHE